MTCTSGCCSCMQYKCMQSLVLRTGDGHHELVLSPGYTTSWTNRKRPQHVKWDKGDRVPALGLDRTFHFDMTPGSMCTWASQMQLRDQLSSSEPRLLRASLEPHSFLWVCPAQGTQRMPPAYNARSAIWRYSWIYVTVSPACLRSFLPVLSQSLSVRQCTHPGPSSLVGSLRSGLQDN
jgi:hypothetical protein